MHEENSPSHPEQYSLAGSASFGGNAYPSSAGANVAPVYSLEALEMMKRASSQSFDAQAGLGGLATLPSSADASGKKARFVSEGNIPSVNQQGFMSSPGMLGSYGGSMPASAPPNAQSNFLGNLNGQQSQIYSGVNLHQGISNGSNGSRSFSANMTMSANSMAGAYNGPVGGNPGSPHFIVGAGGLTPQSGLYGGFPGGFATSPAFMPNVGLLSGVQGQVGQGSTMGRTVYVGNLPADASVDELLNLVKFGPIENVRLLPEKNCAFISFLDGGTAAAFHADACVKKVSLHNQELKVGWGKPSACPAPVMMAVQQNQATRNVYLGQLDEDVTEQTLRDDLARFGPIDQVKIVRDKNIGFVHFLSIQTAMKVVSTLPTEPAWAGKRVNYGKDRCAYVPKSQQQNQAHNNQAAAMGMAAAASLGYPTAYPAAGAFGPGSSPMDDQGRSPAGSVFGPAAAMMGANVSALTQIGNRTVYLGNIHPETTTEEICNHIRGGILQNIRYIPEKHIAFVTFVDPNTALAFFHLASYSGIMIHNRRLKIGWGKHSGPLSPAIAMAVQAGGSRNVYIGNIDDPETLNEDKIRDDFSQYGEIEMVNSLREKNCAFANFTNIQSAIKCIEGMKNHPDYQTVKIAYGKDRCGNPPRSGGIGGGGGTRKASGSLSPDANNSIHHANVGDDTMVTASESVGDVTSAMEGIKVTPEDIQVEAVPVM
ncbi:hypothetical protein IE53DRAFT_322548 [Violaceomyces palustris]|uniref:Uncharacterized protein n=1 Tax=Violaceomyces palustris TaxID=1673888 RepID=A0ACD0NLK4_9BASI|nr:hypothetical protein IE53DRAFT_322548 [Violaceomyces palustris]